MRTDFHPVGYNPALDRMPAQTRRQLMKEAEVCRKVIGGMLKQQMPNAKPIRVHITEQYIIVTFTGIDGTDEIDLQPIMSTVMRFIERSDAPVDPAALWFFNNQPRRALWKRWRDPRRTHFRVHRFVGIVEQETAQVVQHAETTL